MATEAVIEERLAKVEEAVRDLQILIGKRTPDPDWVRKMIGSMGGDPEFEEVVRLGREIRQADRPKEEDVS